MPFYQDRFNAGVVGSTTGIIFSVCKAVVTFERQEVFDRCLDTIGGITSPCIAGPIIDTLGRRAGMFIGCAIICIGEFSSNNPE